MSKSIVILTATRAEYGLLSPVIKKLLNENDIQVRVAVTGMHLSPEFGYTYREIENDGIEIDRKIEILIGSDTAVSMSKTMGLAMISFAEYFDEAQPDALLVLGDRYETLAVCCAAMNAKIPIIHLHGGETTEGAIDEAIRHSITKMSYLHLTSTEVYRQRVIQLGESPDRVYNIGALGVENAMKKDLISRSELGNILGINLEKPYVVVTYHPVTLEDENTDELVNELFAALDQHNDMGYIITKANADAGGRRMNCLLEEYGKNRENVWIFDSLGMTKYLSAVKYCEAVIGNSSSGVIEVPSFGVPTVNIGDRQRGRLRADSVINCRNDHKSIANAISLGRSKAFKSSCRSVRNPYEGTDTSERAVQLIREKVLFADVEVKKKFYDIEM